MIYSYNSRVVTAMQKKIKHQYNNSQRRDIFSDMGVSNLQEMAATIQDIHDKCNIGKTTHVSISSIEEDPLRNVFTRTRVNKFLVMEKIIEVNRFQYGHSYSSWDITVVDPEALTEFAKQIKAAMTPCVQQKVGSSAASHSQKKAMSSPTKSKVSMNDAESEIDKSAWKRPQETYILRMVNKVSIPGTLPERNPVRVGDYKFLVVWKDSEAKTLHIEKKKHSHMDSLFNLFISKKENDSIISEKEIKKVFETEQPANKAVRDVNKNLVAKLRRAFPEKKKDIPDLIIGHSKKEGGYITLIPICDESTIDDIDRSQDKPKEEYRLGVQTFTRGGKKA